MEALLKVSHITKEYEKVVALEDVSLEIEKGSIFGLLGPNGAGKTSLIRILTGITIPDKGSFLLNGTEHHNFNQISKMIGYLPEERGLYPEMKIMDQLEFFGRIKGLSKKDARQKIEFYSKKLEIDGWLDKKARELSKGMQQLVQFVSCIFYEPSLIILDEPFTGLDPINSLKLQTEILRLQKEGKTIIFSTHRMEQVEEFCESIALINKGKIILQGKIAEIKNQFKQHVYRIDYVGECGLVSNEDYEVAPPYPPHECGGKNGLNHECGGKDGLGHEYGGKDGLSHECAEKDGLDNINMGKSHKSILIRDMNRNLSANILLKNILQKLEVVSFVEILPSLSEIFIEQVRKNTPEQEAEDEQS